MFSNKYAGNCHQCHTYVKRGEGFYDYGTLYCGDTEWVSSEDTSAWRMRFTTAMALHSWLWDEVISTQITFTPTRENAEQMFERLPQAFPSGSGGLRVCPVIHEWLTDGEATAEALAARTIADAESERAQMESLSRMLSGFDALVVESRVRSITQVISKVLGEQVEPVDMTFEQMREVTHELQRRIDKREASKDPNCSKCGGTGAFWKMGAGDKYFDDGCWRCSGTGKKVAYR
jgi:hypothetical protein